MAQKAPGRNRRKGISLRQLFRIFPDNKTAEQWFIKTRWPHGVACPLCGSLSVQTGAKHKTMPFRCRDCRKRFSVRTESAMEASNLGYQTWAIAIYLLTTSLKGVSSMKLHRDLNITQKSAWHLAHRLRDAWLDDGGQFSGPVEVDETYMGGKERNKHDHKKLNAGRGAVGKTAVLGIKDRTTKQVSAHVVEETDRLTLQGFVHYFVEDGATIYTDEHGAYDGLPNHETIKHSIGEYVRGQAHTNGVESFWALLKRGYYGTYHKMSRKHLFRYIKEFEARTNMRGEDTLEQMAMVVRGLDRKRLRYCDLIR